MKALISIDYTNDFVATDGKLTTGAAGQAIETALVQQTKHYFDNGDFVVFAIDGHDPLDRYHPENKLFPPHNVLGTDGRNLFGSLADFYQPSIFKPGTKIQSDFCTRLFCVVYRIF